MELKYKIFNELDSEKNILLDQIHFATILLQLLSKKPMPFGAYEAIKYNIMYSNAPIVKLREKYKPFLTVFDPPYNNGNK